MLTTGASLPSWVWRSSPLPCTQRLVTILLMLWLRWSPQGKAQQRAAGKGPDARCPGTLAVGLDRGAIPGCWLPVPGL